MALRNRMKEQQVRMVLVAMFILAGIYSCTVEAQSVRPIKYMGFQASFGVRSFVVNSNIEEINQMQAGHEGGTLGVVFGNEAVMARIGLAGIFYANANTPRTQHLFETSISTNLYPLAMGRNARQTGLHPYMTAGFSMDNVKFFGTYLDTKNTKTAYEPYLGKISQINVQGGVGLEYRIKLPG